MIGIILICYIFSYAFIEIIHSSNDMKILSSYINDYIDFDLRVIDFITIIFTIIAVPFISLIVFYRWFKFNG